MRKLIIMLFLVVGVSALAQNDAAKAEKYIVTKVLGYNKIQAHVEKGATSKSSITIRIRNLEKIEYVTNDRQKVFLGGTEPKKLLEDLALGQTVWLEDLENINGEYVAFLYPSYEQTLKVFMNRRMTGSYTISREVKVKLTNVTKKMISALRNGNPPRSAANAKKGDDAKMSYEHEYSKALFVYDGLDWFKKTGQFLPGSVQDMYVDWLANYMTATGNDARDYEIKIQDMQKRYALYRDFLFEE